MTSFSDTDGELELLHAYVDGACTAAEAARVDGDPTLRAAADAIRADRDRVRRGLVVPAPPDAQRDAHIAAALAVFDAAPDRVHDNPTHDAPAKDDPANDDPAYDAGDRTPGGGGDAGPDPGDELSMARARRRSAGEWTRRLPVVAAAAAVVVLVAFGVTGGFGRGNDPDDLAVSESTTERTGLAEDGAAGDAAESVPQDAAGEGGESSEAPAEPSVITPDSSAVADYPSVDALLDALATRSTPAPGTVSGDDRFDDDAGDDEDTAATGGTGLGELEADDDAIRAYEACRISPLVEAERGDSRRYEIVITRVDGVPTAAIVDHDGDPEVTVIDLTRCEVVAER